MPRIRSIKPSFFTDENIGELGFAARLFFIGLWCLADREGRLEDKPKQIEIQLLPYDTRKNGITGEGLLRELSPKFITRYKTESGVRYIQIINFLKHQRPHNTEAASDIPAPTDNGCITVKAPLDNGCLTPIKEKGKEKGKEKEKDPEVFNAFWNEYPKKSNRQDSLKAWTQQRLSEADILVLMADVKAKSVSSDWTKEGGKWIPGPAAYLRGRRWEDKITLPRAIEPPKPKRDDPRLWSVEKAHDDAIGEYYCRREDARTTPPVTKISERLAFEARKAAIKAEILGGNQEICNEPFEVSHDH